MAGGEGTVSTALNEHLLSILELSKLISICIMELAAEFFEVKLTQIFIMCCWNCVNMLLKPEFLHS